ncbi:hypothetical protein IB277_07155 [Ensifer sp. ENS07]|uniref:hypothetical protein n=1 Tax=Ensifer sp. ENS07 TaxID=2769274 RepID=UPI00177FE16A|nr:hypothetical protein [Ensifer sp. ENS07]MBD9636070.1 hypothetical protein [Ensifer sp. ENS07]
MTFRFNYTQSKVGITHTPQFAASLQTDYVSPADRVGNPHTHISTSFVDVNGDVQTISYDWEGEFYGQNVGAYQPGSGYFYSANPGSGFAFKMFGSAPLFPDARDYVKPSYSTQTAALNAIDAYDKAALDWYDQVDATTISKVVFTGPDGQYGHFSSTSPVSASMFSSYMQAFEGNDTVIGSNFDDQIFGGKGNDTLNCGLGNDTLFFDVPRPIFGLNDPQNKDKDSTVVLKTNEGRDLITDSELGKFSDGEHSLQKLYFDIERKANGTGTLDVFENGSLLYSDVKIKWDNATPIPTGEYYAYYRYSTTGSLGQLIELGSTPSTNTLNDDGIERTAIDIHIGTAIGNSEGCFIAGSRATFLSKFFTHLSDQASGFDLPSGETYFPVIPATVNVRNYNQSTIKDPVLRGVDLDGAKIVSDAVAKTVNATFDLLNDGGGLPDKKFSLFFETGGSAKLGTDWDFVNKPTILTDPATGNIFYKVNINADQNHVAGSKVSIPIKILADSGAESLERIALKLVDIDIFRFAVTTTSSSWKKYSVSLDSDTDGVANLVENQFLKGSIDDISININIAADPSAAAAAMSNDFWL